MASDQPSWAPIVKLIQDLAIAPVNDQTGKEALTRLLESNSDVDLMLEHPISSGLQTNICLTALNYPGMNLFWSSKGVINLPILQFHDLIPFLGCLTKSDSNVREKILRPSFLKVWFLLCLSFSCVNAQQNVPETEFTVTSNYLLIKSVLYKHEVVDYTEKFNLEIFDELSNRLKDFRDRTESFKSFQVKHSQCSRVGFYPDIIDDIRIMQDLAQNKSLNNIVLNHIEPNSNSPDYMILLRLATNNQFECLIDFSVTKAAFLLAANMFRKPPIYQFNLGRYRASMVKSFTSQGAECLIEGVLYDEDSSYGRYDYDKQVAVSEPALERCSEICKAQNIQYLHSSKINQITTANITAFDCQMFAYSLSNSTCWIKYNAGRTEFRDVEKYTTFDGLSVTGDPNCRSRYAKGYPQILVNGVLTDARKVCKFASQTVVFQDMLYRCLGLYNELSFPLNQLQMQLDNFVNQIRTSFGNGKKLKIKRSIVSFILQNILKAAGYEGFHNLGFFPSMAFTKQILNVISTSLKTIGRYNKIVLRGNSRKIIVESNLTAIISAIGNYDKIFNFDLQTNYNQVLSTFRKQLEDVISFYSNLVSNAQPYKSETKRFVQDENYLYTFSITNNVISRQFVKTYFSKIKNATSLAFIPLSTPYFQEPLFWKTAIKAGALQNENRCFIALLKSDRKSFEEVKSTCIGDKITRGELSKNIFVIAHQFGAIQGSLLVMNKKGIIEISCLASMLIEHCFGLCIIALSEECQIVVNSELIRESNKIAVTFAPTIVINRNRSLFVSEMVKSEFDNDEIQFSMIGVICLTLLFVVIAQVTCLCCNKIKTNQNQLNVLKPKETNSKRGSEDEHLNFIAKL